MTNHWIDLANSDCILMMGANPAENHPICFKWVLKAQDAGAVLIHVDPRFTRTSAKCDIYTRMRVGTDIPFLSGMISYILKNKLYLAEYVRDYTNAAHIVNEKYSFKDGFFSGYDAVSRRYNKETWAFERDDKGVPKRDTSYKDPRCVMNLMAAHYARYTVAKVAETTGISEKKLLRLYETYTATGKQDKAGTILYGMGWTQKSVGVQNIRAMAIIQLLLGNVGVAGGHTYPCRPALYAHFRKMRHIHPHAGRYGYPLPRRHGQLYFEKQALFGGIRARLYQCGAHSE